jgi:hypothetical protein
LKLKPDGFDPKGLWGHAFLHKRHALEAPAAKAAVARLSILMLEMLGNDSEDFLRPMCRDDEEVGFVHELTWPERFRA